MTLETTFPPPESALPPVRLDPQGRIDEDVVCRKCGYNMRTLLPDSRCPECGTATGRSLQGDFLRFAEPGWVQSLASGMNWIFAGVIIGALVGGTVGGLIGGLGLPVFWMGFVTVGLSLIGFVGYWKVTTPDPAELQEPTGMPARKLVRITQSIGLAITPFNLAANQSGGLTAHVAAVISAIIGIVVSYAMFTYARQLALRLPDDKLARHCTILMWAFIASSALGYAVTVVNTVGGGPAVLARTTTGPAGTGPLISMMAIGCFAAVVWLFFGLWSLRILLSFRKQFRQAASQALATWAAPIQPNSSQAPSSLC